MTQRKWQEMTNEEFAEWYRNLKLKALDESQDERTRKARAAHEHQLAIAAAQRADPNSELAIWLEEQRRLRLGRTKTQPSSPPLRRDQAQALPTRPRCTEIERPNPKEQSHDMGVNWAALVTLSFLMFLWWEISKLFR